MQWTLNEAKYGDLVRVKVGNFYHYGIYVSDDEVVQFGLPFTDVRRDSSTVEVCTTDVETFLCGNFLEVGKKEKKEGKIRKPKDIVKAAKSRLGEKGYHILYNNCEHFVYECAFGKKHSSQVDEVRQMWHNFPFINVYVKKFPFKTKNNIISPKERQKEIDSCSNCDVKQEKFYSWKLLEEGLFHSIGKNIKDIKFTKNNSKWSCNECNFSISHCNDLVAVVVSRNSAGVDLEEINTDRFEKFQCEKILTEKEIEAYKSENKAYLLNEIWTKKEAEFKRGEEKTFIPNKIDTTSGKYKTIKLKVDEKEYFLTIASNDISFLKLILDEEIKKQL